MVRIARFGMSVPALMLLAACTTSPEPNGLDWDPYESQNRIAHSFNREIDRAASGPLARSYGKNVPQPVRQGVSNFRTNWRQPHHTIHYLAQGRPALAWESAVRFLINTVFGAAGVFDIAAAGGVPYRHTSADETFHVWGLREGAYLELPAGGPGTERDWAGWAVDVVLDPTTFVLPVTAVNTLMAASALDLVNDRYALEPTLTSILHESVDSYTALRISYLQTVRARQDGVDLELLEDIYDF